MPRSIRPQSRRALVTDRELALEGEVKRLRAELSVRRKASSSPPPETRAGLSPEARFDLAQKMGHMFRNLVLHRIGAADRCAVCGGLTDDQIQAGWEDWAAEEEAGVARAKVWRAEKGEP